MRFDDFHAAALALPGARFEIKWGNDRVYTVGGKMFAVAGVEGEAEPAYSFKVSDGSFEQLCEEGVARPAPYLARAKWVQLTAADALADDEIRAYLEGAWRLIAAKLPRKTRAELGVEA